MTAPQSTAGGSLDRLIDRVNRWFTDTHWDRLAGSAEENGEDPEPGSVEDLQRELQDIRLALGGVRALPGLLDRFSGLSDYQADLAGVGTDLAAIAEAATRLTTPA